MQLLVAPQSNSGSTKKLDGAKVSGSVTVLAQAAQGVDAARFYVDDPSQSGKPAFTATSAPFAMKLDTTRLPDGSHAVTVNVDETDGQSVQATSRFVVANQSGSGGGSTGGGSTGGGSTGGGSTGYRPIPAATLYVDPSAGSDSNSGRSASQAFKTVQHAADVVQPGDVVYLRGGVYPIQERFTRSGTSSAPIVWTSYPGEWAIFDGSDQSRGVSTERVWVDGASWNVFMNFEVRNSPQDGIYVRNSNDNIFSNIWTHGNNYCGIANVQSSRNRYEYIVAYDNFDQVNPSGRIGDDADGIGLNSGDSNVIYHSLVFNNSDDGVDTWQSTHTLVDHVISHDNGRGPYGNGNGIKAGGGNATVNTVVRDSIAFDNRGAGFTDNSGLIIHFYNDTSFNNGTYAFMGGATTVFRNDLAFQGGPVGLWGSDSANNSWDLGISDPKFVSTDPASPDFLSLQSGSPAIGAGTDVGLPYSGSAPDLGALPYSSTYASLIAPITVPLNQLTATAPSGAPTASALASR
ncbi:MAG: right-handed parallel beta-helix repeat-containing protein [Deinococcales bacterium]